MQKNLSKAVDKEQKRQNCETFIKYLQTFGVL